MNRYGLIGVVAIAMAFALLALAVAYAYPIGGHRATWVNAGSPPVTITDLTPHTPSPTAVPYQPTPTIEVVCPAGATCNPASVPSDPKTGPLPICASGYVLVKLPDGSYTCRKPIS